MVFVQGSPEAKIRAKARELSFDAIGFAAAAELDVDHARYEAFVDAGMHGAMAWLAENRAVRRRVDTPDILEGARTVICVASRYASPDDPEPPEGSVAASVARYARGRDYHNRLRARVRRLAAFVRTLGDGVQARPMVDTAPVLERAWAARAGLGFVGKNGLVIAPGQGSFLLLGEVVTTLALEPDTPIAERCGECTRCLDACPTGAFPRPFVLDAKRCVSYLTIELRGPTPEPLRSGVGENLFGCDMCQDVCPFNKSRRTTPLRPGSYAPHDRWQSLRVEDLLELDDAGWQEACTGTPLARATPVGLVRNAVTVLANRGDRRFVPRLERLAREHSDPSVREHAEWAVRVLGDHA